MVHWIYSSRTCTQVDEGRVPSAEVVGIDALVLLAVKFDADSIPPDGRLSVVARFGVGYDSVDVAACTAAGIAVTITPDGVRRPVATSILGFILALSLKLVQKNRICRLGADGFAQRSSFMGEGLVGKTLGCGTSPLPSRNPGPVCRLSLIQ